MVAIFVAW